MSRKGENIYKRKDGRWEGRYRINTSSKKNKYGYVYGRNYSDVRKELNIKRAAQIPGKKIKEENFDAIANLWLADIKPTIKASTWNKYQNLLNAYIMPTLNKISIGNIDY